MKKILFAIYMIAIIVSISAQTRIAVLPFTAGENVAASDKEFLSETFMMEMFGGGKFIVLERMQLDRTMKELSIQNTDEFDDQSAVEIGKLSGAEQVYFGSVFLIGSQYHITIRCVDIKTGTIMFAKKGIAEDMKQADSICKKMAMQIIDGDTSSAVVQVKLTAKEREVKEEWLDTKYNVSTFNYHEMKHCFNISIACGIVKAIFGTALLGTGIGLVTGFTTSDLNPFLSGRMGDNQAWVGFGLGLGFGVLCLFPGLALPISCITDFLRAKHISDIYEKSTGKRLVSFLSRTSIGGGYDWNNKEIKIAMAIKL